MAERNWYEIVECNQCRQHSNRGTEVSSGHGSITFKSVEERTPQVHLRLDSEDYDLFVQQVSSKSCSLPANMVLRFQVQELLCKHGDEPWKVVMRLHDGDRFEFEVPMDEGLILMREMLEDMEDNY
jgi:hypothetical protein